MRRALPGIRQAQHAPERSENTPSDQFRPLNVHWAADAAPQPVRHHTCLSSQPIGEWAGGRQQIQFREIVICEKFAHLVALDPKVVYKCLL
ncbi:hypothetical protein MPHO_11710 [Mycolicibacterium phocaicum]|nr:hypothetical protein MPHO_11710 [Mycolicibacterium phocaicum]